MNDDHDLFDLYAAIALHALIAKLSSEALAITTESAIEKCSDMACEFADAMLRAKERQG